MHRRVALYHFSSRRVVIQFDFRGTPQRSYWLLIDRSDVSVCLKRPGFEVDVILSADIKVFYQIWLGRMSLMEAMRRNQIGLEGNPTDIRAFHTWFTWSPMAATVSGALADSNTASYQAISPNSPRRKSSAIRMAS